MLFSYELLNEVQLNHVANFYDISEFEDGEKTGSDHKELKHNMQMLPEQADVCWNIIHCLLYTSPSPRDATLSRMPSSA